MTLDENHEREKALSNLDEADFTPAFLTKLKSGKLDTIDWDKELVVPILRKFFNKGDVKAMELEQILGNSDQFAQCQGGFSATHTVPWAPIAASCATLAPHSRPPTSSHNSGAADHLQKNHATFGHSGSGQDDMERCGNGCFILH